MIPKRAQVISQLNLIPLVDEPRAQVIPSKGSLHPRPVIAVDFGASDALALHGASGPIKKPKLPAVKGGRAISDDFTALLPLLLEEADVVVEDSTVGSSGVELDVVAAIVAAAPFDLWKISGRAVKNYRKDHGLGDYREDVEDEGESRSVHADAAAILYLIATEHADRLTRWKLPDTKPLTRRYTSVRPHDKRGYRDEDCDRWMRRYPLFSELPPDLRQLLGNGNGSRYADYSRAKAMPFAMAMEDSAYDGTRKGYERVLGLYDHGYPSFYRRATIVLMQANAKRLAGVTRIGEVPPPIRKEAWRLTRRQIRQIYHLLRT